MSSSLFFFFFFFFSALLALLAYATCLSDHLFASDCGLLFLHRKASRVSADCVSNNICCNIGKEICNVLRIIFWVFISSHNLFFSPCKNLCHSLLRPEFETGINEYACMHGYPSE
ncbi:hypothetical protein F5Y09DRAFT_69572 [Xylaria sp. FL1042]|nr:hypothetical protein F5Y09DRAFT_69572 [Xylaria sp. FL1042]